MSEFHIYYNDIDVNDNNKQRNNEITIDKDIYKIVIGW